MLLFNSVISSHGVTLHKSDIEHLCRDSFGVTLLVKRIVIADLTSSKGTRTTVFESTNGGLYAFSSVTAPLVLADIQKIMTRVGISVERYLPPRGDSEYFLQFGRSAFLDAYPGRRSVEDRETTFYQTLAPYGPALVKIARIKEGLFEFIPVVERWHKKMNYSYNPIEVRAL